jgi:hypothetical protein
MRVFTLPTLTFNFLATASYPGTSALPLRSRKGLSVSKRTRFPVFPAPGLSLDLKASAVIGLKAYQNYGRCEEEIFVQQERPLSQKRK